MGHREHTEKIRQFILRNVRKHPGEITRLTAKEFGFSRQAVNRHLDRLVADGLLEATGSTLARKYSLKPLSQSELRLPLAGLEEDRVWLEHVAPLLSEVKDNVRRICEYGFTEMLNNAVYHSEGQFVVIGVVLTGVDVQMLIQDDGVGIFRKIKTKLGFEDERQAILELAKGKLTTDPEHHTGEGIFFTTRMFDQFALLSGKLFFSHMQAGDDWLIEVQQEEAKGTLVNMIINRESPSSTTEIYEKYASEANEYGFTRTHVPVALVRHGSENLVSRSQAKRLLARFEKFREVFLDFADVESIGQAFADEIFRVFRNHNPQVKLTWVNAKPAVQRMIQRALGAGRESSTEGE